MKGLKEPPASEITPEGLHADRRAFLKKAGLFAATSAAWGGGLVALASRGVADPPLVTAEPAGPPLPEARAGSFSTTEPRTPFEDITTYNNFYELGLDKADPARNAGTLKPRPWSVRIEGEVERPQTVDIDTLLGWFDLEERVYRMRCVERWSMVIPWLGFPLAALLGRVGLTSRAKYVAFETLLDPAQLPGQRKSVLPWPYVEGLRIDEAMSPLTLLSVGLYGKALLGQNGAPLRLVVPWKYGFKSIKSIVRIAATEQQPKATWNEAQPSEYGFYANVNPGVAHPRWSQAVERRIGELAPIDTQLFNGYGEQVAGLYAGMDLAKHF